MDEQQPLGALAVAAVVGWAVAASGAIAFQDGQPMSGELLRLVSPYLGAGAAAVVAALLSIEGEPASAFSEAAGSPDLLRRRAVLHSAVLVPLGAIIGLYGAPSERR
jgi:hypothetical protein